MSPGCRKWNRVGGFKLFKMKTKFIHSFGVLRVLALFASIAIISCEKSDEIHNAEFQSQIAEAANNGAFRASSCQADCLFAACSVECSNDMAECWCMFGFANCDCRDDDESSLGDIVIDENQAELVQDLAEFVRTGLQPSSVGQELQNSLFAYLDLVSHKDWRNLEIAHNDLLFALENLSSDNKTKINDFLISIGQPTIF
ncbi:MAG: hypothetical protein EA392_09625 [Cryomorphaceae bacterium]|nr:MAG: hypothetical protein EA392_09625 [Cryomorphaceae bacterium]